MTDAIRPRNRALWIPVFCLALLVAEMGQAQLALPISNPALTLTAGAGSGKTVTVELDEVPLRPELIIEVVADPAHPDMLLEIELSNWVEEWQTPPLASPPGGNQVVFTQNQTLTSNATEGGASYIFSLLAVDPLRPTNTWLNASVDVTIRAVDFGSAGAPANVAVDIFAVTRVPTDTLMTEVETLTQSIGATLYPTKDTTVYERFTDRSNGAGEGLWTGTDRTFQVAPFMNRVDAIRSLIAFDISGTVPSGATITDATLFLEATTIQGGGGNVKLHRVPADAPPNIFGTWFEGSADAGASDFTGATSPAFAANWLARVGSIDPWSEAGAGPLGPPLASNVVTTTGLHAFSSPALVDSVQDMLDQGGEADGFLLDGPTPLLTNLDQGVRFASRDHPTASFRPILNVVFEISSTESSGTLGVGALLFISEGENFRWIYDVSIEDPVEDGIHRTGIDGVCEVIPDGLPYSQGLPYTYVYEGAPGYSGVDCCTWQISSPNTGTTGTGQALFFHNLNPSIPGNLPPDTDGDGIVDSCDNCIDVPNGPFLGTCIAPTGPGGACQSNLDCDIGAFCQQSQQDADGDFVGDACAVPEPGLGAGLLAGVGLSIVLGRSRQRSRTGSLGR